MSPGVKRHNGTYWTCAGLRIPPGMDGFQRSSIKPSAFVPVCT